MLKTLIAATAVWLGSQSMAAPVLAQPLKNNPQRPNVIVIFADDMGYGDLTSYGASDLSTPNLDALAEGGVRFTDSYSISPVCSPSRAGLLTGRYPIRMGIHEVFMSTSYTGMPDSELTMAELLKSAGYDTAMFGKWHLGHHEQYMPHNQGFDTFYGYPYSNDITPFYAFEGKEIIEWEVDQTRITQQLTQRTVDYITASGDKPFFIYLAQPMPHIPLATSEVFKGRSARGPYGDVIEELDWSVGKVVTALKTQGKFDNTLLLFASDNGPWLIAEEDGGSAAPLRSGKGSTWEGGMRVPTIASWPEGLPQGKIESGITTLLDWLPTVAAAAKAEIPSTLILDGMNLLPALSGDAAQLQSREFTYYNHGKIEAYRQGDWKLKLPNVKPTPWIARQLLTGEDDIIDTPELYNLRQDPGETVNLASKYPERLQQLQRAVARFEQQLGPVPEELDIGMKLALPSFAKYPLRKMLMVLAVGFISLLGLVFWLGFWRGKRSPTVA